ncbi:MAG: Asp-tRNA(Asn)/Glu-tRNA(Gln) amidotransferase subunit GatB [Chlorobi bacterium]|nr:Asp-tRNA(Asn)/Glu-tRNA(Gln) amidotransferase subunit GatB [Chlorobiota bacterium]
MQGSFEALIGLEIHVQLRTATKAFCSCPVDSTAPPNTLTCPVCLGHPGTLPVANRTMIEHAVRLGLAVGASVNPVSTFSRKNYFYPDLPKGYQITQFHDPLCSDGRLDIESVDGGTRTIRISRIHLEEDAAKSIHAKNGVLLDLNRCGVPLLELVTEPDLRTATEARITLTSIRQLVTYLGISDGEMETGSLRCDANVSVRRCGDAVPSTWTELKNMNSPHNVETAVACEIERQVSLLRQSMVIQPQTFSWDDAADRLVPMRSKDTTSEYRYFPDPDLPPVEISPALIESLKATQPELPAARRERIMDRYHLSAYDARVLTAERSLADYYEQAASHLGRKTPEAFRTLCHWTTRELLHAFKEQSTGRDYPVPPDHLAFLVDRIVDSTLTARTAAKVFLEMIREHAHPGDILDRNDMVQISHPERIAAIVATVLDRHPDLVEKYLSGKASLRGFFIGEIMKATKGRANPLLVAQILEEKLEKRRAHP